jgi:hypothetical protein
VIAYDLTEQYRREYEQAVTKEQEISQQHEESNAHYKEAQTELHVAQMSPGSLIRSLLYWFGAFAAAVCEFYITNVTLPMALDIERASLLGIALSLGPVVAFVFVEKPLEYLQQSAWRKVYIAFLWLVLIAHLGMALLIADAREEIAHVLQQLMHGKPDITFDDAALNRAILAVSVLLVIDGACFLLWAQQYGHPWLRYRKALAKVRRTRKRRDARLAEKTQQTAEVAVRQARMHDNRPALIAENFKQQCLVALERLTLVEPTSTEKVEGVLGLVVNRSTAAMN